jgi:hypothetical protein
MRLLSLGETPRSATVGKREVVAFLKHFLSSGSFLEQKREKWANGGN